MLMTNDVPRAYFNAKIQHDVCIELPKEDPDYGKGLWGSLNCVCMAFGMLRRDGKKLSTLTVGASDISEE